VFTSGAKKDWLKWPDGMIQDDKEVVALAVINFNNQRVQDP
jgi:hypothetical protein